MKKSRRRLTFAAALAGAALAATLTACHETVYGPPETVYGPPSGMTTDPCRGGSRGCLWTAVGRDL